MKTVTVNASQTYEVQIAEGILSLAGNKIQSATAAKKVAIISDTNVFPLYGQVLIESLNQSGLDSVYYVFPAGEQSKNGLTYLEIMNFLAENQLTRSDCLVALGGGVVGDLTGFAAATYLRGIAYVQIPTTLLAMVDSSVGGKTAIDLPAGKNLCGAFYQPRLVLCDLNCLISLSQNVFRDGCAEVIKYGILYDSALFNQLAREGLEFHRENVIARCVELKRDVVEADEFDTGARMKLNLGHTLGHGVEARSHFTISHGQAVAIGMAIIARCAASKKLCEDYICQKIISVLSQFGLPTETEYTAQELFENALSDKKRAGGTVNLIVPVDIGSCTILPTGVDELKAFIEEGL